MLKFRTLNYNGFFVFAIQCGGRVFILPTMQLRRFQVISLLLLLFSATIRGEVDTLITEDGFYLMTQDSCYLVTEDHPYDEVELNIKVYLQGVYR